MPIDNITLMRHEPPPPEPPRRPRWVAPLVFLIGAGLLGAGAVWAWGDPGATRVVERNRR